MNLLDKIFVKMTVTSMLNPENKDLYVGNLTLEKVESILSKETDDNFVDMFWTAYNIACAKCTHDTHGVATPA